MGPAHLFKDWVKTMRIFSKLTGGIAAVALVASATAPASARSWDGYYGRSHGPSAGAVIGVIAGIGLLAAIASASSSKSSNSSSAPPDDRRYDAPPPTSYSDRGYDDRYDSDPRYDSRDSAPPRYDDARGARSSQDAAVDACVLAARDQASRNGNYAEVRGVTSVNPRGSGWDVIGQVDQRSSYRAQDGWSRSFRCSWQGGQVSGLSLN